MNSLSLIINQPTTLQLQSELFPSNGFEAGAVMLLGKNDISAGPRGQERRYLSHKCVLIPPVEVVSASAQHFSWKKTTFLRMLKEAIAEEFAIGFVHSHRGGTTAFFSEADDQNDGEVAELVHNRTAGKVDFVSIVIDEHGNTVARRASKTAPFQNARVCCTLGTQWRWCFPETRPYDGTPYDRQVLAFGPEFLESLRHIRIGIAGAGATGSATGVFLARNGAADLQIFDHDVVEHTNLSRLHGATVADADNGSFKVDVLKSHIESFGLGTAVSAHRATVDDVRLRQIVKSCDLILGCTDDHAGRLFLNRLSYFYNIPLVDMGISIDPRRIQEGFIASADARVTVVGPGAPCLACRRVVDSIKARDERLAIDNPQEFARQLAEGYVTGQQVPNPAVITLTTAVACMAVDEITARLTMYRPTLNNRVRKYRLGKDTRPGADAECGICGSSDCWGLGDRDLFLDRVG